MAVVERGFRSRLDDAVDPSQRINIVVRAAGPSVYDFVCFGVDENNKLADERYMVFYNQLSSPRQEISLKLETGVADFSVYLNQLPKSVNRLVFAVSIDGAGCMNDIRSHIVSIIQNGREIFSGVFLGKDFVNEKAVISLEIYLKGVWRANFVAQGFSGGLSELLKYYGGEEDNSVQNQQASVSQPAVRHNDVLRPVQSGQVRFSEPAKSQPVTSVSQPAVRHNDVLRPVQSGQVRFSEPAESQPVPSFSQPAFKHNDVRCRVPSDQVKFSEPVQSSAASAAPPASAPPASVQNASGSSASLQCPACGSMNPKGKFCRECGSFLSGAAVSGGKASVSAAAPAPAAPKAADLPKDPLSQGVCAVGNVVKFGKYPLEYDGKPVPAEWKVLDIKNGRALLLSEYCLNSMPYHRGGSNPGPDKNTVHAWLNSQFKSEAFSSEEQSMIECTLLSGGKSDLKNLKEDSIDSVKAEVFLLSLPELFKYMPDDDGSCRGGASSARVCRCTEFSSSKGAIPCGGYVNWWLRSSCEKKSSALCVSPMGNIGSRTVAASGCGVRPAVWIKLK